MKILYKPLLLATTLFLLLTIACCKDDCDDPRNPDCPNYIDCAKYYPLTTASFTIKEGTAVSDLPASLFIDTDTCYIHVIDFEAKQAEADSFIWQIGTEPEPRYGKKVRITFPVTLRGSTFTIRLIIKAKPHTICNPNDDGIDTVIRQFYFMKRNEKLSWEGTYYGSDNDKPDSLYTIVLGHSYKELEKNDYVLVYGIPRGCIDTLNIRGGIDNVSTYKKPYFISDDMNCKHKSLVEFNVANNSYFITYWFRTFINQKSVTIERTFTGKKIQ